MYQMSDYFKSRIQMAGGPKPFAQTYAFSQKAIEGWYSGTRRIQTNSAIAVAAIMGIGVANWKILVV